MHQSLIQRSNKTFMMKRTLVADLTLFDAATIIDRATYADPDASSEGIYHVLVKGVSVVRDGDVVTGVCPGRPVMSGAP
jgi:N-acyl-D-amino-acid deacylase